VFLENIETDSDLLGIFCIFAKNKLSYTSVNNKETYKYWENLFSTNQLNKFNGNTYGLLWLKIKAINRRENHILNGFCNSIDYNLQSNRLSEIFPELYDVLSSDCEKSLKQLDDYLIKKEKEIESAIDYDNLVTQLYNVNYFRWSAGNNNDLGKSLIEKYVKHNASYDYLINELDKGIATHVKDYLVCTWYNHWTSILIENIFKSSRNVVSAIGRVKSVDFFIDDIPFDLKVTHLPQNFIDEERVKAGLKIEGTTIRKIARDAGIIFNNTDIETIVRRIKDDEKANDAYEKGIVSFKNQLIESLKNDASPLERNLYEQQGAFRFGAENRLFLVLIDKANYEDSWKLKRNINLLEPKISDYLNNFDTKRLTNLSFNYDGKAYSALCDTIIIEK
jgi:hypothetical protein